MVTFYAAADQDDRLLQDQTSSGFVEAPRWLLRAAGLEMVKRMVSELSDLFWIGTFIPPGDIPADAQRETAGARDIHLHLEDTAGLADTVAQVHAPRARYWEYGNIIYQPIREGVQNRIQGRSPEDIRDRMWEEVEKFQTARQRLLDDIATGRRITLKTRLTGEDVVLAGWDTNTTHDSITANPFTYYLLQGDARQARWVDAIHGNSRRALNAFCPTMHYLHELGHVHGYMFSSGGGCGCQSCNAQAEEEVSDDVDQAIWYHTGIGRRYSYLGSVSIRADSDLPLVYVDRPDARAMPRPEHLPPHDGAPWVLLPTYQELATGWRLSQSPIDR